MKMATGKIYIPERPPSPIFAQATASFIASMSLADKASRQGSYGRWHPLMQILASWRLISERRSSNLPSFGLLCIHSATLSPTTSPQWSFGVLSLEISVLKNSDIVFDLQSDM